MPQRDVISRRCVEIGKLFFELVKPCAYTGDKSFEVLLLEILKEIQGRIGSQEFLNNFH
jgi:hypothetical protein